jgi:hypothetical protein
VPATIADHIHPHKGDQHLFWFGALQSLCRPCHESGKKFEEARGFSCEVDASGMPVDKRHPIYVGHLPEKLKAPPVDPVDALILTCARGASHDAGNLGSDRRDRHRYRAGVPRA